MPCSKVERIGIFGGAFDPPHKGHLRALESFLDFADPDRVYVIPSGVAPHKDLSGAADGAHRMEMANLTFGGLCEKVTVSDLELKREGPSYSYLTVRDLQKRHPKAELFLFVGTDQFLSFETWRRAEELFSQCTLCVMDRYESDDKIRKKKRELEEKFGARCLLLEEKAYITSSTEIREELKKEGFSPSLTPEVNDYITLNSLYGVLTDPKRKKALDRLKKTLSPDRLSHTLSVERETVRLCELLDCKECLPKLRLAALYHDLAKPMSAAESLSYLADKGWDLSSEDRESPQVLHGFVAYEMLREREEIPEAERLAVRYHTTGRAGMTLEEKILCFADYIEETRTHEVCRKARDEFYRNLPEKKEERLLHLDACLVKMLESTVFHLQQKEKNVHPLTLAALSDLKNRKENQ